MLARSLQTLLLLFTLLPMSAWGEEHSTSLTSLPKPQEAAEQDLKAELEQLRKQIAQLELDVHESNVKTVSFDSSPTCGSICGTSCTGMATNCWTSGYAVVFMKPHLKESFQAFTIDGSTGVQDLLGFSYDYDPSSRVWLGYTGDEGLGMRVQYWHFDHSAAPVNLTADATTTVGTQSITVIYPGVITSAVPGDVLQSNSGLQLQTLDLEATQQVAYGKLRGTVGGGVRYARLLQTSHSTVAGAFPQTLDWRREFEGVGPLASMEFTRPWRDSRLSFVGGFRAGLLFGTKTLDRFQTIVSPVTPPEVTTPTVRLNDVDEVTAGGEIRLGVQWNKELGASSFFVRGTYEGQLWTDAGAPTLTFLGFEGFAVACGISM